MKSAGKNHLWERIFSAEMKSVRKNHLWKRIFVRRDEISGDESSLEDIFNPQG